MTFSQKKITYIIGSLEVGGAEMHLSQIAPQLKKNGWDISVLTPSSNNPLAHHFENAGIPVLTPPIPQTKSRLIKLFQCILFLYSFMRKNKTNCLHFFLPEAYLLGMFASFLSGHKGKKIMSRRSLNTYQKRRPLLGFLEHRIHRFCDAILVNAARLKEQLIAEENVSPEKVNLIYNGVDENRFSENNAPNTPLHLVCVANLIPYKGHLDLIESLHLINDKLPPWQLTLVGNDRGIKKTLTQKIDLYGLNDHIVFSHDQSNPAHILSTAHIGILPSHEEGFSNALLEMMASKLAVIATNVGGNSEAVIHNKTGLIVPAHQPEELAQAILKLALDSKLRQDLAACAKKRFDEHFTLDHCINQYQNFYQQQLS